MEKYAEEAVVLAVDPGSAKCGVAVVARSGRVLHRAIVSTAELPSQVQTLTAQYQPVELLVGRGTGSKPILSALQSSGLTVPLQSVDEAHTSEQARRRWVAETPPRGLEWLLPKSLRTPSVPYDDYVAVILAERFWAERA